MKFPPQTEREDYENQTCYLLIIKSLKVRFYFILHIRVVDYDDDEDTNNSVFPSSMHGHDMRTWNKEERKSE